MPVFSKESSCTCVLGSIPDPSVFQQKVGQKTPGIKNRIFNGKKCENTTVTTLIVGLYLFTTQM